MTGALPTFLIIGAMTCALHGLLGQAGPSEETAWPAPRVSNRAAGAGVAHGRVQP